MLCFSSCSDFLEEDPKGQMTNKESFAKKSDLAASINALMWNVKYEDSSNKSYVPNFKGDDLTSLMSKTKPMAVDAFKLNDGGNADMKTSWAENWIVVKSANLIILDAPKTPGASQEEIDQTVAQARFWRAITYFRMVRAWGPVPILTDRKVDLNVSPNTEEEVFKFIEEDLLFAEAHLPIQYSSVPWFSNGVNTIAGKAAASSALSAVYMTMAGFPLNKGKEYYVKAATKAKEVIDASESGTYPYKLNATFFDVYSMKTTRSNSEIILGLYYSRVDGTGDSRQVCRAIHEIPEEAGGWGSVRSEVGYWYNFPAGPRKKTIFGDVYWHKGDKKVVPWFYENVAQCKNPYYKMQIMPKSGEEYDQFVPFDDQCDGWGEQTSHLIRLDQLYLWYAECIGRAGEGDKSKAIEYVNIIRRRADGKALTDNSSDVYSPSMSYQQLAEAAYNEHGWEIGGCVRGTVETRYHDQRRMNRLKDHFEFRKQNPEYDVTAKWLEENPEPEMVRLYEQTVGHHVIMKEPKEVTGTWSDDMMYNDYPSDDVALCPNLKRP